MSQPGERSAPKRIEPKPDVDALLRDHRVVEAAMGRAVRRALWVHKQLGQSIAVWRDGRVVVLSPEEIPVDDEG